MDREAWPWKEEGSTEESEVERERVRVRWVSAIAAARCVPILCQADRRRKCPIITLPCSCVTHSRLITLLTLRLNSLQTSRKTGEDM